MDKASAVICLLLIVGCVIYLILFLIGLLESTHGLACLNPRHNKQRYQSLNWFGVIVTTLFFNLILSPYVPFYWFYKLMTVKRKDK